MHPRSTLHGLLVLFAVAGACLRGGPVLAQAPVATLEEMRELVSAGDAISIVRTTGAPVRGQLVRFGDTDLDIRAEARDAAGGQKERLVVTVPRSAIQSLERPRDSSKNGALIGAAVGGGFVLGMFVRAAAVDANEMDEWAAGYMAAMGAFAGIGALAGWAIDRANSKPHVRFDAASIGTSTIRVVPQLSRGPGVALVLSF